MVKDDVSESCHFQKKIITVGKKLEKENSKKKKANKC